MSKASDTEVIMTKEEVRSRLRKAGYKVVDDNSVVTVLIAPDMPFKATLKDVRERLKGMGYDASFSIRQQKDIDIDADPDTDSDTEISTDTDTDIDTDIDIDIDADIAAEDTVISEDDAKLKADRDTDSAEDICSTEGLDSDETDYFDEEDSDMILNEDAVQFSLDDFGLDY